MRIRPKEECYKLAKELRVEIDEDIGDAWAPRGYRLAGNGTHCVVFELSDVRGRTGLNWWGLLRDLKEGLEPCDDPGCDICHE